MYKSMHFMPQQDSDYHTRGNYPKLMLFIHFQMI